MLSEDVVRLLPEIPHRSHHQQQSERQEQIEATLSYEPSSGDLWLKAYGGDILEYLQSFYPPEMKEEKIRKDWSRITKLEINFVKKLTTFLDEPTNGEFYTGKSLAEAIKEKVGALKGELNRLEAIRQLQSEKDASQFWEKRQTKMTYAEIEEKEKLLAKDPDRQESLTKKINEVILRKGIEDWFKLHAQHTDRINASFRAFLDETTLPPLEVAKVGKFSIMDLTTPSHLRAESDCMGHCVGTSTGYAEKIRKWQAKIFSIRSEEKNPLNTKSTTRYTIEYDVKTGNILQWKGDKNANLSSVLNKAGPQHKTELIKLLIALSQEYPINNAGSDLQALIVDGECLWSDGTIESLPDTQTVIDKYLTGKEILVGEKPTFTLDEWYSLDQVSKLCSYPNLTLDLTHVAPAVKAQLSYISGKVIDLSVGERYVSMYPKLRKFDRPITTSSHIIFYDLEKKQISAMEIYKWNEKERKAEALQFLKAKDMDTPENRAKIDAVKFGTNYVEIWGVKFSSEKLKPQSVQRWTPKKQNYAIPSNKKGLRKNIYNGAEEYYYDLEAYEAECEKQGKKAVMKEDLEKAMQALVGNYKENIWYEWWNILSILLWMSMSGYVDSDGELWSKGVYGYLGSASPSGSYYRWYCRWYVTKGVLSDSLSSGSIAFPCVFLL